MRGLILALLIAAVSLAGDLPTLTTEEMLQVRMAQLVAVQAENKWLQSRDACSLTPAWAGKAKEAQAALFALVASLRPAECEGCTLSEALAWERSEVVEANGAKAVP